MDNKIEAPKIIEIPYAVTVEQMFNIINEKLDIILVQMKQTQDDKAKQK